MNKMSKGEKQRGNVDNITGELNRILRGLERLGQDMRREHDVYKRELEERLRLGLTGDAAIRHYNEWMTAHDMEYLTIKDN